MFSSRLPLRIEPTAVSAAVARARAGGTVRFDLTETNPTAVGLEYPVSIAEALGDVRGLRYDPQPLGGISEREAIVRQYAAAGVRAERVMLTASTSEAYSFLFKLLCNPGDDVLVPHPSYPLFDLLTRLDAVRPVPYRLDAAGGWCLDRGSLQEAATPATRAVLVVSPNNPTGSILQQADREWLVAWARERHLALISDEVFADYPLAPRAGATTLVGEDRVLTFVLGGLSKSVGLPQMKVAWTLVSGPPEAATDAMARLELIADSYLSVATPVQVALPLLLERGQAVRRAIRERIDRNLAALRAAVSSAPALTLHEPEGGWSAVVRVPAILSEDEWVVHLLERHGVLVHPGFFFDIDTGAHLVISLLPQLDVFEAGVASVADLASEVWL